MDPSLDGRAFRLRKADCNLRSFGLRARRNGTQTVFACVVRRPGTGHIDHGTTDVLTFAEAREKAAAAIAAAKAEHDTGSSFTDCVREFQRHQGRRWEHRPLRTATVV